MQFFKNTYYKYLIAFTFLAMAHKMYAQTDSTKPTLQFSGYAETYYSYDLAQPANHTKPNFLYSHNRHNEFNLNLGFIKANFNANNVRVNLALATGTYMNANYSAEPEVLKNIFESNVGVKISKKKNVWVDAGVFASHIGFESAIGKDCWTVTRSLSADNTPYYEAGVKIGYTTNNGKWFLSGLVLNGWQRIQRVDGNSTPAFGHQITYKPNSKITINSSSFIGNDKPDSVRQMRYFHNLYAQLQATDKIGIIVGFDIGAEQKAKGSSNFNAWYNPVIIAKFTTSTKSFLALRLENYTDKNGVIISTGTPNGFQTLGYSVNYDYLIRENTVWRTEAKGFSAKDKTFIESNQNTNTNYALTTSLAISF